MQPEEQEDNSSRNCRGGENNCAESRPPQAQNIASRFAGENKCADMNDRGDYASMSVSMVGW